MSRCSASRTGQVFPLALAASPAGRAAALASLIQLQKVADQEHEAMALIRTLAARLEQMPNRHLLK